MTFNFCSYKIWKYITLKFYYRNEIKSNKSFVSAPINEVKWHMFVKKRTIVYLSFESLFYEFFYCAVFVNCACLEWSNMQGRSKHQGHAPIKDLLRARSLYIIRNIYSSTHSDNFALVLFLNALRKRWVLTQFLTIKLDVMIS